VWGGFILSNVFNDSDPFNSFKAFLFVVILHLLLRGTVFRPCTVYPTRLDSVRCLSAHIGSSVTGNGVCTAAVYPSCDPAVVGVTASDDNDDDDNGLHLCIQCATLVDFL
jgi:hypothetical protein